MALTNRITIAVALRSENNLKLTKSTLSQKTTTTRKGVEIDDPLCSNRSQRVCPRLIAISAGFASRTVNYEISALRGILKSKGFWSALADEFDRDLSLVRQNGAIREGALVVPKSKTEAGTGRMVPLTSRACAVLHLWLSRFPQADEDGHVFPRQRVGLGGDARKPYIWDIDLNQPIGEWKKAWGPACQDSGLRYRWHDCRHTFISRLAQNPQVSEETIRSLAGHVSKRMLERYSHIRTQAKRDAIAVLNRPDSAPVWAGDWVQSYRAQKTQS
jgi:hypothetical protein